MDFTGRVFFDLGVDSWRFLAFVTAGRAAGVDVRLDWQPLAAGISPDELALRSLGAAKAVAPDDFGRYLQALMILRHEHGVADLETPELLRAASAARLDPDVLMAAAADGRGAGVLDSAAAEAAGLGVTAVPALYRHGPVLHVLVNGAAAHGDVRGRFETLDRMLTDDGLWLLAKPREL